MNANEKARNAMLLKIAQDELFLETLETRNSDRLDFHDMSVGCIRAALEAAYEAGRQAGQNDRA